MFLAVALSSVTNLLFPVLGVTQYIWMGPMWTIFAVGAIAIAIIKHRLFDIKLAAVRSIAYVGMLLTLSGVYYISAYLLSVTWFQVQTTDGLSIGPINIALALMLAFIFQPLKRFFDKVTNDIFYRDNYNSDEFFARLSELLASTTDLRGLLERASLEIASTFKAEQAFFYLYFTNGTEHHMSAGTQHHSRLPVYDAHAMDRYIKNYDSIILTDALPETSDLRRILISHKIALLMPLKRESTVIGYVCLGDQLSGHYAQRDLKVLATIADELVIAIQNALSVHEVKEINATLQQRIDVATKELRESNAQLQRLDAAKDEFVSMASHQLRTPLTSVKGYISMLLDGDAGKLTETQQKLLSEAFKSSERMVGLISDFLSVSRVQTGRFMIEMHRNDLAQLVAQEVDSLQEMARSHDLKLHFTKPNKPVNVDIDEEKVRQIVMNFIDNAVYYSPQGGAIEVNLAIEGNQASLTVTDTGIGVPASEQTHLFSKFYRATNARKQRPDGTGVGLYLAKKVITGHHGKLIFTSEEGKGSTFGFSLPLAGDDEVDNTNAQDDHGQ
jgi:signal transduction histidine kinase